MAFFYGIKNPFLVVFQIEIFMISLSEFRVRIDVLLQENAVFLDLLLKLLSFRSLLGRIEEDMNEAIFFVAFKQPCLDSFAVYPL